MRYFIDFTAGLFADELNAEAIPTFKGGRFHVRHVRTSVDRDAEMEGVAA